MASIFETLGTTIAARLRAVAGLGLTVQERKAKMRLDKDTLPSVYVAPIAEQPKGYCMGKVVIIEYSFDVVIVSPSDQKLDPPELALAPNRVELIRSALDLGVMPGMTTIRESRWEMSTSLYDRSALSNNYDLTAMRWYYKSDEVRP